MTDLDRPTLYKATREWERRFRSKVQHRAHDECWPWLGSVSDGYGVFWLEGRNRPASQCALALDGRPVDTAQGQIACHHCDNPICVNPTHLYVGTPLSNVRDMDSRGRRVSRVAHPRATGERNHRAKLTDRQVQDIRARYTGRRGEQTEIAQEYGVTQALISLVVRGGYRA